MGYRGRAQLLAYRQNKGGDSLFLAVAICYAHTKLTSLIREGLWKQPFVQQALESNDNG